MLKLGKDTLHEPLMQLNFDLIWFHYRPLQTRKLLVTNRVKPWASLTIGSLYNIKLLWQFYLWSRGKAPYHFRINIESVKTQMETRV